MNDAPEDLKLAVDRAVSFSTGETDTAVVFFADDERTGKRVVIGQIHKKHKDQIAAILNAFACANTITNYMKLAFADDVSNQSNEGALNEESTIITNK